MDQRQTPVRTRAVRLLVLSMIGILAAPSVSLGLEKYGRPLPSMAHPDDATARKVEETLFGGYVLTAAFVSNPPFAARPDNEVGRPPAYASCGNGSLQAVPDLLH